MSGQSKYTCQWSRDHHVFKEDGNEMHANAVVYMLNCNADLLAACEALIQWTDQDDSDWVEMKRSQLDDIRAAIDKARGTTGGGE